MNKYKHGVLALVASLSLIACGGGGGGSDKPNSGGGQTERNLVNGIVRDSATGLRLAGVTVSGGGRKVVTNASGEYSLPLPPSDQPVTLSFTKANYAPGFDNVVVNESADALLVSLKRQGDLQDYNSRTTRTIFETTAAGPYAVIFQPDTLNSNDVNLRVSVTPLDPTIESDVLPGELGKSDVMLTPLTFAEFTILDSKGNHVNLRPGSEAVVELPIPPTLRDRPEYALGETIHCYSFNPETGQWEDFVEGTIVLSSVDGVTPVVRATVKHFSWYGAAPETDDCEWVVGTVVSAVDGKPLPGARVEAFPGTVTKADKNGFFQVVTSTGTNPEIVATRTYIDTDGSVSGMPGAKVIEFGKVKPDYLYPLISCRDALQASTNTSRAALPPGPNDDYPQVQIVLGAVSLATYGVDAFLLDNSLTVQLYELLPDGQEGEWVSGAKVTLVNGQGQVVDVPEWTYGSEGSGIYMANLTVQAGERYTLNIDVDNNGTIDGSGFAYAIGDIEWANPVEGGNLSATNFIARWTDTGTGTPGYAPVYYAVIIPQDNDYTSFGYYVGSVPQFNVSDYYNPGTPLSAGTYSASVSAFSGAAGIDTGDFSVTNNITGPTVNGSFWSWKTKTINNFTLH